MARLFWTPTSPNPVIGVIERLQTQLKDISDEINEQLVIRNEQMFNSVADLIV